MNKLVVPVVSVALGVITVAAFSQQAPPASGFQAKPYFQMRSRKTRHALCACNLWSFLLAQATNFIATPAINGGLSRRAKSPSPSKANNRVL